MPKISNDGIAGTLLGLLYIYAIVNEAWLLEYIQEYIDALLKNARFGKVGLYWDTSKNQSQPLCGFSHGSSGVGFVFLELGRYFNNPAFYFVAGQAFAYENHYFNKHFNNWPDFRLDMFTKKQEQFFEKEYKKGNMSVFTRSKDVNAWCHGAMGIGLSRLHAYQLLKKATYNNDIKQAYSKTLDTNSPSFTLCHGNGGNVEFFLENYLFFKNKSSLHTAEKIADLAIMQKQKKGKYSSGLPYDVEKHPEDPSFFNGIAGIGYLMLRLSNPEKVRSLVAPKVPFTETKKSLIQLFSLSSVRRILLTSIFKHTIQTAEQISPQTIQEYFSNETNNELEIAAFVLFIKRFMNSLPTTQKRLLYEVFIIEKKKSQFQQKKVSNGLIYIKEKVDNTIAQKLLTRSLHELLKQKLYLSPLVNLAALPSKRGAWLFKRTPYGVEELQVSYFCFIVLHSFSQKKTVDEVINKIQKLYKPQTLIDETLIKEKALDQIKEAINYTILLQYI